MGHQIIIQPDGKYAIYSSNVDDFLVLNATEPEIAEYFVERAIERFEQEVAQINFDVHRNIKRLKRKEKPYYQFTMSFKEALEMIEAQHGIEERDEIWKLVGDLKC